MIFNTIKSILAIILLTFLMALCLGPALNFVVDTVVDKINQERYYEKR